MFVTSAKNKDKKQDAQDHGDNISRVSANE
jgi:hypothetical protein